MANLEQFRSWISDEWSVILTFVKSVKRSPQLLNLQEIKIDKENLKVVCKSMKRIRLREKCLG